MTRLSDTEIEEALAGLDGWEHEGDAIVRDRELGGFTAAIAFVNRVAEAAEAANHHPDILVHDYKRVRLTLSTHSAGGVTRNDVELARRLDEL